jgi:hypothetical protein
VSYSDRITESESGRKPHSCPPQMAPGLGDFNAPPVPTTPNGLDCKVVPRQLEWSASAPQSVAVKPKADHFVVDLLSFAFNALAVTALAGATLMASLEPIHQYSDTSAASRDRKPEAAPKLVVTDQQGSADEPLPLGILVKNGSGEESVTISGLPKDVELSLGTPLGTSDWWVPARDLQATYVGATKNTSFAMKALVKLHSLDGQLLDSQLIRFEWIKQTEVTAHPFKLAAAEPPEREPHVFKVVGEEHPSEGKPYAFTPEEHAVRLRPESKLKQQERDKLGSLRGGDAGRQPSRKRVQEASSWRQAKAVDESRPLPMRFVPPYVWAWRIPPPQWRHRGPPTLFLNAGLPHGMRIVRIPFPEAVPTPAQRYMNTKKVLGLWTVEDLHLREEPNPSAKDVLRGSPPNDAIPKGTMVRLHTDQCVTWSDGERSALWCKVDYKKYTGWVNSHYLSEVAPDSW